MSLIGRTVSAQGLRVFEVAARHLSFTAAARELRSTQSAVSQQIRALEEQLGIPLFERIYRGVRLTEAGQALFTSVQDGFATIERTLDRLHRQHRHRRLNILTDFSFAAYWLLPRLPQFRHSHPDIDVRLTTQQGTLDWHDQDVDVALLFCNERMLVEAPRLFGEEVLPVCSPAFLERHGPIDSLARLAELPLMALFAEDQQPWLDWPEYFRQLADMDYAQPAELTFNNYTLLIQAVIAGQGIGLGWRGLIDDQLASGVLVGLEEMRLATPRGYGLIDVRPSETGSAKQALCHWLLEGVHRA
ncbi:choline sulfate utilization transcriptional regulator [Halomonas urumqiensis]|uniref:LysR family transcriptional regulator n=1 Tax=Halomonas urumqiensis TaxID=1684789 RepID=A0A2N7UMD1_9GAMM|nr:LysR substrate-binding domain-containing protein [Halomonas urumqiensis]PMR81587.1 LysR family transcriptional regulator [Halomonas urumqiensis]PTB02224.1 LysR family transcriptional regulator [Halomonas urumqiensis]GHE21686.1 transcriptional regulator [Halomonas urumqiensis]